MEGDEIGAVEFAVEDANDHGEDVRIGQVGISSTRCRS